MRRAESLFWITFCWKHSLLNLYSATHIFYHDTYLQMTSRTNLYISKYNPHISSVKISGHILIKSLCLRASHFVKQLYFINNSQFPIITRND